MRRTSVEAYKSVLGSGKIRVVYKIIYDLLYKFGPLTAAEVWFRANTGRNIDTFRPRMAELQRMHLVEAVGERKCSVTSMRSLVWDVTSNVFIPEPRKPSAHEHSKVTLLRNELQKAHDEIERLRKELESIRVPAIMYQPSTVSRQSELC